MANKKITELDAATALASTDVVPVVDVSEDVTKKITATNLFRTLPDGTAAAPALAFSSDQANGVYLAGTDTVGISTGGTQRVTVDGSGNVTISGGLTVEGQTTTVESTIVTIDDKNLELGSVASPSNTTADGGGITLKGATDKTLKWINSTGCWTFNQPMNFNDHVRIDSSGRVGIGVTDPGYELEIGGSSNVQLALTANNTTGNSQIYFGDSADDDAGALIYRHDGNSLAFTVNAAERLRIDSSGRLLVGTTTPSGSSNLQVAGKIATLGTDSAFGTDSIPTIYRSGSTAGSYPFDNFGHLIIQPRADGAPRDIVFATGNGGTNKTVIDSNGRLGIGTTAPSQPLTVNGVARFENFIEFAGSISTPATAASIYRPADNNLAFGTASAERMRIDNSGSIKIQTNNVNLQGAGTFRINSGSTAGSLNLDGGATNHGGEINLNGGSNGGTIQFRTGEGSGQQSEKARIDSSGNFGIGTSSPDQLLHLEGSNAGANIRVQSRAFFGGQYSNHFAVIGSAVRVNTGQTTGMVSTETSSGNGRPSAIRFGAGAIEFHSAASSTAGAAFDSERMRIHQNGNVGIGQNTPASKLHVSGTTTARFQLSTDNTGHTSNDGVRILVDSSNNLEFLQKESANIEFFTASTERMRIDSSGRVGIGTTSPSAPLQVAKSGGSAIFELQRTNTNGTGTVGAIQFTANDGHSVAAFHATADGNDEGAHLIFRTTSAASANNYFTSTAERMRLDSSGRLLLGTTTKGHSTADLFTIASSSSNGMTIRSGSSSSGQISFSDATTGDAEYRGQILYDHGGDFMRFRTAAVERFRITSTGAWSIEGASNYGTSGQVLTSNGNDAPTWQSPSAGAQIIAGNTNVECVDTGSDGHILFDTEGSERMRIDSSGRVGIGITSPEDRLDLGSGNLRFKQAIGGTGTYGSIKAFNTLANSSPATSIRFIRDVATVGNDGAICFDTTNSERARIDSSGRFGIKTSSPNFTLDVNGEAGIVEGQRLSWHDGSGGRSASIYGGSGDVLVFANTSSNTERMRIDNSGRLLVGTTTARSVAGITSQIQLEGTGAPSSSMSLIRNTNNTANPYLFFGKTRGSADGSNTAVQNGDYLGAIYFAGADGTDLNNYAAAIYGNVDGTPGSNDMPGRLTFETTSDGSGSSTERMRIDSSGNIGIGTTSNLLQNSTRRTLSLNHTGSAAVAFGVNGTREGHVYVDNDEMEISATDNYMYFTAGSSERMRIDTSGRVMIGTSSNNGGFLTVDSGGVNSIVLRDNSIENHKTNGNAEIAINYHGYLSGAGQFRDFRVYNGKAGHLATFDGSSGRLGVGASATSPGGRIHIHNGSSNEFALRIDHDHSSAIFQFCEIGSSSYVGDGLKMHYTRGGSNAFNFMAMDANHGGSADREFTLRGDGHAFADGNWNSGGADYAEFFESSTGAAIPVGTTVVLDNNKVRAATAEDAASAIMGVVRPKEPGNTTASVGNTAWNRWNQKYLTDDFDRYILDEHVVYEWTEEVEDGDDINHSYESHQIPDGITVPDDVVAQTHDSKGNRFVHYRLNPDYDPAMTYVPREERDEWVIVGLVGQVKMLGGQPVNDRWVKMRDVSDTVEQWFIR